MSDKIALAGCVITSKEEISVENMARITQPALVAVGTKDDIGGNPHKLAALMPQGEAIDIPNRDHMLAVGDKVFKQAVLDFLERHPL
jgi:pimeloyl-ACP methyl ester carboxylesterase